MRVYMCVHTRVNLSMHVRRAKRASSPPWGPEGPPFHVMICTCAGSFFNIIADHLSHNRRCSASRVALSELGVTLQRLPSHRAR